MEFLEHIPLPNFFYENLITFGIFFISWIVVLVIIKKILGIVFSKISRLEKLETYKNKIIYTQKTLFFIIKLLLWLGILIIIGFGAYNIVIGKDIYSLSIDLIDKIPNGFWLDLAINIGKIIALIIFSKYFIKYSNILLEKAKSKILEYQNLTQNNESIEIVFSHLNRTIKYGAILAIINFATLLLIDSSKLLSISSIVLLLFFIINIGLIVVSVFNATIETIDAVAEKFASSKGVGDYYTELHYLVPVFKRTIEYIIYTITASFAISQIEALTTLGEYIFAVVQAIGAIFIARVVIAIFNLFIDRNYLSKKVKQEVLQRNQTIYPILKTVVAIFVYFATVILIMTFFGFNPLPLLAGAGILGMALGFGAQNVINDILSGFIIIMENNYKVGDIVEIDELSCTIEEISLRTTKVRAEDGKIIILRNGDIKQVVNHSYKYSMAMVDIGVDKDSNLEKVYQVLEELSQELAKDNKNILEPMKISGVEDFLGPEIIIRTTTKLKPGKYLETQRLIREAVLLRFRREGIVIPFEAREGMARKK